MNNRNWVILCWNVRGVNSEKSGMLLRIELQTVTVTLCLQETKREHFDDPFLRNICPPSFDKFVYLPSVGASGGSIVI